jgi:hypothetical protein
MFRVPGMSRQPQGILASGTQIMNAAQRNMVQNPFMMGDNAVRPVQVSTAPTVQAPASRMNTMDTDIMNSLSASEAEAMLGQQFSSAAAVRPPADPTIRSSLSLDAEGEAALKSVGDRINESNKDILSTPATETDRLSKFQSDMRKNIDDYRAKLESAEPPSLNSPIAALGGDSYNKIVNDMVTANDTDIPSIADYKLSDFKDLAMEVTGRDRDPSEVADEDRDTAFWLNLMKAGLAIASGESSNALTNVAKGLSFGLESYAKDMSKITDREREDNRELAGIKFALLKDQKDADVAQRAAKIQGLQARVAIADKLTDRELAQFDKKQAIALQGLKLENDFIVKLNEMGIKLDELAFNKDKFNQTVKATLAGHTPKFVRELAAAGYVAATDPERGVDFSDPNSYTLTEAGQTLFSAYVESKGTSRITELMSAADAAAEVQAVDMLTFNHLGGDAASKAARNSALLLGKMKLPSDMKDKINVLIPIAQAQNARTTSPEFINYVLEENVPGVKYFDQDGTEVPQEKDYKLLEFEKRADFRNRIAFIEFSSVGKPPPPPPPTRSNESGGSRVLATPE